MKVWCGCVGKYLYGSRNHQDQSSLPCVRTRKSTCAKSGGKTKIVRKARYYCFDRYVKTTIGPFLLDQNGDAKFDRECPAVDAASSSPIAPRPVPICAFLRDELRRASITTTEAWVHSWICNRPAVQHCTSPAFQGFDMRVSTTNGGPQFSSNTSTSRSRPVHFPQEDKAKL